MAYLQQKNLLDDNTETHGLNTSSLNPVNDAQNAFNGGTATQPLDVTSRFLNPQTKAAPANAMITSYAEPEPTQAPTTTAAPAAPTQPSQPVAPKQDVLAQPGVGAGTGAKASAPYVFNNTDTNATKGSGFTNLKRYLSANKQGGENLGTQVATNLGTTADTAKAAVTALRDKALANPLEDVNNSAEAAAAQKAIYTANEQAGLANTDAGRAQLIRNLNPNVNLAGSNLNSFLMGNTAGATPVAARQAELAPMQKAFGDFTGEITKSATAAQNAKAEQERAAAQAAYEAKVAAEKAEADARAQAQFDAQQKFYADQLALQRQQAEQAAAQEAQRQQQYQAEQARLQQEMYDRQTAAQKAQQDQQTQLMQQLQQQIIDAQTRQATDSKAAQDAQLQAYIAQQQQLMEQMRQQQEQAREYTNPVQNNQYIPPTPGQVTPKITQKATPEQAQALIGEAQRRAAMNGTTGESEVWKYAVENGFSPEDIDAYFGWNQGASRKWAVDNGFLQPGGPAPIQQPVAPAPQQPQPINVPAVMPPDYRSDVIPADPRWVIESRAPAPIVQPQQPVAPKPQPIQQPVAPAPQQPSQMTKEQYESIKKSQEAHNKYMQEQYKKNGYGADSADVKAWETREFRDYERQHGLTQNTQLGNAFGFADGGQVNVAASIGKEVAGPVGAMLAEAISAAITNSFGDSKQGYITGPGGPREDKIPAKLSDGEYVIPAHIVEKYGKEFFDQFLGENSPGVQRNK